MDLGQAIRVGIQQDNKTAGDRKRETRVGTGASSRAGIGIGTRAGIRAGTKQA